jgi:hypothetical protein
MRWLLGLVLALWPLADAAAQSHYGQCADAARDRLERDWNDTAIGPDRARNAYIGDIQRCTRLDAEEHARDAQQDEQRAEQRQDQQRADEQRLDEQRLDQRIDQQRADQRRLDQQRRQREDWLRQQQQQQQQRQ